MDDWKMKKILKIKVYPMAQNVERDYNTVIIKTQWLYCQLSKYFSFLIIDLAKF